MPRMYTCAFILSLSLSSFPPRFTVSSSSRRVCVYTRLAPVESTALRALLLFLLAHCRCHDNAKYTFFLLLPTRASTRFRSRSSLAACNVGTSLPPPPLLSPRMYRKHGIREQRRVFRRRTSAFSSRREFFFFFFFFFSAVRANRDNIEETWQGNRCYTLLVRPLCRVDIFFLFNLR